MDVNLEILAGMPAVVAFVAAMFVFAITNRSGLAIFCGILAGLAVLGTSLIA